jgi:ATP-dependent DNA helicase RecQ
MGAVLLDLDETLVLTAALEPLRNARRWREVYEAFGRTSLPPGTRDFVARLRRRGQAGVVTSGPRSYAERLLAHHAIDLPVLVAYHDVTPHKPAAAPLLRAIEILGLTPGTCVSVGNCAEDDSAAHAAGVASVLIGWTGSTTGYCTSWDEVIRAIDEVLGAVR